MSELRRWSEEGATAHEMSLVEASRLDRAPPHARARALQALGAAASQGGLGVLAKVMAISLLGSGIVAGGLVARGSHHTVSSSSRAVPPTAVELAVVGPPNAELAAATVSGVVAPVPVGGPARLAPAASTDDRLAGEVAALERAHQALAAHNHEAALHLLDRYRTQFPSGALASEETVLRVQALLASGDRLGAQALADAHSAAHPDSPYARRLEDLVHRGQLPTP